MEGSVFDGDDFRSFLSDLNSVTKLESVEGGYEEYLARRQKEKSQKEATPLVEEVLKRRLEDTARSRNLGRPAPLGTVTSLGASPPARGNGGRAPRRKKREKNPQQAPAEPIQIKIAARPSTTTPAPTTNNNNNNAGSSSVASNLGAPSADGLRPKRRKRGGKDSRGGAQPPAGSASGVMDSAKAQAIASVLAQPIPLSVALAAPFTPTAFPTPLPQQQQQRGKGRRGGKDQQPQQPQQQQPQRQRPPKPKRENPPPAPPQ